MLSLLSNTSLKRSILLRFIYEFNVSEQLGQLFRQDLLL